MRISTLKTLFKDSYKPFLYFLASNNDYILHKIPFRPILAAINITNKCNSRCITCNMWRKDRLQQDSIELTTSEVINTIIQLKNEGISYINFAGGEPLLRSDLPDIIYESSNMGIKNISIFTNGLLLNRDKIKRLIECGLTEISISIDGIKDTNDYCRGIKGSYERNIENIILMKKEFPNLHVRVMTTLMRPNLYDIIKLVNICKELDVVWFMNLLDDSPFFFNNIDTTSLRVEPQKLNDVIKELHKVKRESNVIDIGLTHTALDYTKNYINDPKKGNIPCIIGFSSIYIGAYGDVYSGCWALKPLGNLRDKSLKEIIDSYEYKVRLQEMFKNKCPGCTCGYQANLLYHIPSIINECVNILSEYE